MSEPPSTEDVLEELAQLPTMAHPTVAPDGREIALYYDITGRNELHVFDSDTGELTQLSEGDVPRNARWFSRWSPEGELIFFHIDEAGDEQNDIYAITRDGTVTPIVEMGGQVTIGDVGPHGDRLVVGSSRDGQMNLYSHDLDTGDTTKLTEYDRAAYGATFSPDGDRIAYATNETDDYDNRDVYVMDVDGTNKRNLEIGEVGAEAIPHDWGPDDDQLLVSDNTPDLGRAGLYDPHTDEVQWLGDGTYEETGVASLDDGRVLVSRSRDAVTMPVVYEPTSGERREFDLPDGVASLASGGVRPPTLADGRVVLTYTTPTQRPELLVYDLETDDTEALIEAEYGPFDPSEFADAEYFTVASDGIPETPQRAVEHDPYATFDIGALLYDSGARPSPLVVNPHGGPRGRDTMRFDVYTQVLVARGFSVLQVNYRGSTGRGREFVEELIDDWGGAEQGDVATVTEHVLAYDWIDENRVVVFGGSFGGYSAYWQSVQYPDLYDASIAWIGLTDLPDMYENTMPHFQTELMEKYLGNPEENADLYEERSPVTHVENIDGAILVVHGVNDRRVPVSQARIIRNALQDVGYSEGPRPPVDPDSSEATDGDFEYRELGEEGHASTDQDQKLRLFRLLDNFLERRVDGAIETPSRKD